MSTASPRSLLFLTVDYITRNYKQLCEVQKDLEISNVLNINHISLFGFKNCYCLPSNICELLLQRFFFHHDNSLPLDFLTLFTDADRCPLKRFSMGNVYHKFFYDSYLLIILEMIIKCQNLLELDVGPLYNHILLDTDFSTSNCATTLKKLTTFGVVPGYTLTFWVARYEPFTDSNFIRNFGNLKHLSLDNCRNITDNDVALLASGMKHLESLDLSSTCVSETRVFDQLTTKLKVLIIHNTPLVDHNLTDLLEFSNLRHLDISRTFDDMHDTNVELSKFFTSEKSLPLLTSLDVSGAGTLENEALQSFLHKHRKLCFLGLLDVNHMLKNTVLANVEVTGEESLTQVLACLSHYRNRPLYLTKAFKELYNLSCTDNLKDDVELRKRIIELVLDIMRKYMDKDKEDLQTAASACLYNYVRYDTENGSNSLHVSILSDLVAVVTQVLQKFSNEMQIQRNCLIVLYNKYILSAANFNAYLLSDLFFKATMLIPEGNVPAIALDMCAYLSSRISVEETLKLGTSRNIEKLLLIIRTQVDTAAVNQLLLCSLRVLWNLTDEAPETCRMVIDNGGLPLVFRALQKFDDKNEVLTKLLGVMKLHVSLCGGDSTEADRQNNLSEVVAIRLTLMCDELVSTLRKYLDMNYAMDVSYFAAGTLCNLILDWPDELTLDCGTQSDLLSSVGSAVNRWKKVETVMVGYRTFKSFLPLLHSSYPDVQLWAIWAIHHVCSQKVERYGQLCSDEGVVDILKVRATSDIRSDVKDLAIQALDVILKP